jgi:UDP-3-O-[3-hydroxymyristoyl] glucosamine N-acyltransferase
MLTGIAPLHVARPDEVSFLHDRRYATALDTTLAGAVIVPPDMVGRVPSTASAISAVATYEGWARVAGMFHPIPPPSPGVHPTALVAPGGQRLSSRSGMNAPEILMLSYYGCEQ